MELNTDETNLHYCRFCSEKKKPTDLLNFVSNKEILEQIINFTNKFQIICLNVSIENKLPKAICSPCYNNIIQFNSFITRISQSQILLNKIYNIIEGESDQELEIKHEKNGTISDNDNSYDIDLEETPRSPSNCTVRNHNSNKSNQTKVLIKNENGIKENTVTYGSWTSYSWFCVHCKAKFTSMNALRSHSKLDHKTCFGYSCADCKEKFNVFNLFIDHVRRHRPSLRYYCQYCNQKFETIIQCFEHSTSHSQNGQEVCELCGEMMKDNKALKQHMKMFRKVRKNNRPRKITTDMLLQTGVEASWLDYNWSCQVCCQRLPNADSLRSHIQNVHSKCFAMKCMDCTRVLKNFKTFVAHVHIHRPYLKKFCQYCNTNVNKMSISTHMKDHEHGSKQACPGCGQMFQSVDLLQKHMQQFISARPAHSLTEDDLTCVICKKVFATLEKLRQHRKTHDTNRTRNYTCDSCGKAFFNLGALKSHKVTHSEKMFTCKLCQKGFHTKANLKEHVAMHLNEKPYQCDECGKGFNVKLRLKYHLSLHTGYKPHKCSVCGKAFRFTNDLKIHSRQHTGLKPFACEVCDRAFVNASNCNKHMLGKHGVSLQKKKDKSKIDIDDTTKEWIYGLIHNGNSNEVVTENKS